MPSRGSGGCYTIRPPPRNAGCSGPCRSRRKGGQHRPQDRSRHHPSGPLTRPPTEMAACPLRPRIYRTPPCRTPPDTAGNGPKDSPESAAFAPQGCNSRPNLPGSTTGKMPPENYLLVSFGSPAATGGVGKGRKTPSSPKMPPLRPGPWHGSPSAWAPGPENREGVSKSILPVPTRNPSWTNLRKCPAPGQSGPGVWYDRSGVGSARWKARRSSWFPARAAPWDIAGPGAPRAGAGVTVRASCFRPYAPWNRPGGRYCTNRPVG